MGDFKLIDTHIQDLLLIEPKAFEDSRGFFLESYNKKNFKDIGVNVEFVQDNHSLSSKGVLRGLHFQSNDSQAKLVRVIKGKVFDVAVDIREGSPSYLKWFGTILSDENKRMMYIPEGFAHGFLTLEDNTHFVYKVNNYYNSNYDTGIRYDDPLINIEWPRIDGEYTVSDKDSRLPNVTTLFCGER